MSYVEFAGFPHTSVTAALSAIQMSSTGTTTATGGRGCCENGRPIMTDPHTGQTICSCQYSSTLLNYSRVTGLAEGMYGTAPFTTPGTPGYMPLTTDGSAFYSPLANAAYDIKETPDAWRTLGSMATCFPYDPSMTVYPYGSGYGGLDLNARRKNATRETTNTLKAWLYEHRKNPYPTKGEKIMLAIITKMTLTQVSTWFANARRRLKKENKITWSPRNRSDDGGDEDNDDELDNKDSIDANISGSDNEDGENHNDSKEKIINVDDESNHSMKGHLLDNLKDSQESRQQDSKNNGTTSPVPSVGDDSRVEEPSPSLSRDSDTGGTTFQVGQSDSERDIQTRPKIWSVTDFLQSSTKSSMDSSITASVKSSQSQPPGTSVGGGYFYLPASSHSWVPGRYGSLSSYPLSINHSTLSYPYTMSTPTSTKQTLTNNVSSLSSDDTERTSSSKLMRPTNGLFSPARDIDGIRNGEI